MDQLIIDLFKPTNKTKFNLLDLKLKIKSISDTFKIQN